jgi:hypothetical protein
MKQRRELHKRVSETLHDKCLESFHKSQSYDDDDARSIFYTQEGYRLLNLKNSFNSDSERLFDYIFWLQVVLAVVTLYAISFTVILFL